MWKKLLNKYRAYLVLAIILTLAVGIFFYFKNKEQSAGKSTLVAEIIRPWQKLTGKLGKAAIYVKDTTLKFIYLKNDNEKLKKELSNMVDINNRLQESEKENERLKKIMDYRRKISFKTVMAQVIGTELNNYFGAVTIDLGEKNGVVLDMPVITPDGVIGKIMEVYPEYSLVLLLTDYKSGISGIIQKTRVKGAVKGVGNGMCKMQYLSINEEVKEGDSIVTSGDAKFPKGLLVGKVASFRTASDSMSLDIDVVTAVNVLKLEEVLVVFKE